MGGPVHRVVVVVVAIVEVVVVVSVVGVGVVVEGAGVASSDPQPVTTVIVTVTKLSTVERRRTTSSVAGSGRQSGSATPLSQGAFDSSDSRARRRVGLEKS